MRVFGAFGRPYVSATTEELIAKLEKCGACEEGIQFVRRQPDAHSAATHPDGGFWWSWLCSVSGGNYDRGTCTCKDPARSLLRLMLLPD